MDSNSPIFNISYKRYKREEDLEDIIELDNECPQDRLLYHAPYSKMSCSLRNKEYYMWNLKISKISVLKDVFSGVHIFFYKILMCFDLKMT